MLINAARNILKQFGFDVVRRYKDFPGAVEAVIVPVAANGGTALFLIQHRYDHIQRELAQGRFYEIEELALNPGSVFVDVGANVGVHSIYAAKVLHASKVIAIEPNPIAYRLLCANAGLNCILDRFVHHAVALSDETGRGAMDIPLHNLGAVHVVRGDGAIQLVPGDDILRDEPRIDFIKIDTEGMELNVLRGLSETITRHQPTLFVEVDERNKSSAPSLLAELGYRIADRFRRYETSENFLALPPRRWE